jgi:2-polyprenyl-6-hydroxyphenyl methylase/3-demethylubiquinone-9 3-methyltransferase
LKRFVPDSNAPESWHLSFAFDEIELYGKTPRSGYARAYDERRRRTIALVEKYAPVPARIIDVAAAQGNFTLTLAERGYDVTWNDLRAELAEYVERKRDYGTVRYLPGNAFELDHRTKFDVVLITEVIEHVAHPDEFLQQAASLAAPGGYIIMTTPNGNYFRNRLPRFSDCSDPSQFEAVQFKPDADGHIFLLHTDEIETLSRKTGLRLKELRLFNNPLTAGALGTRFVLPFLGGRVVRMFESVTSRLPFALQRRLALGAAAVFQKTD